MLTHLRTDAEAVIFKHTTYTDQCEYGFVVQMASHSGEKPSRANITGAS